MAGSIADVVATLAERIAAAGVGDTPRLDAELIVGHELGLDRVQLRTRGDDVVAPDARGRIDEAGGRRVAGEPVAYILGSAWFYGREFLVDSRVLIPRPETDLLVDIVLGYADGEREQPLRIVDVGTGSGCIAVTLAAELGERARVVATDISDDAANVARTNAQRNDAEVEVLIGDLLEPVQERGPFDVIVSNPPYVDGPESGGLDASVRDYEPHIALFAHGGSVPTIYERLARESFGLLAPGGICAVEHGQGQRDMVRTAFTSAGFAQTTVRDDLAGIDRVVLGKR